MEGRASEAPVSHTAREVQAGLSKVGLEVGLQKVAPTLGTDVGGPVLMCALVSTEAATIGEHHGAGRAHLSSVKQGTLRRSTRHPVTWPKQAPSASLELTSRAWLPLPRRKG